MFNCPFCYPDTEETLIILPTTHKEFISCSLTEDGTRKWFLCNQCGGVFCRDKLTRKWQLSPITYDKFVNKGLVKNQLNR